MGMATRTESSLRYPKGTAISLGALVALATLTWSDGAQGRVLTSAELGVEGSYSDNFFLQKEPEQEAFGLHVLPSFQAVAERDQWDAALDFEAELARFSINDAPNSEDDFFDNRTSGTVAWRPLRRHGFALDLRHNRIHDPFGTARTEEINDPLANRELDRWMLSRGIVTYNFGAPEATINVALRGGEERKRYLNNRYFTRFLDYRATIIGSTLFYNLSPRTAFLFDAQGTRIRFDEDFPGTSVRRDAEEVRVNAGIKWNATRQTRGEARIGYLTRNFADPERSNFNALDWQLSFSWTPISRTSLTVASGRNSTESFRSETRFLDNRFFGFRWQHEWTRRIETTLSARYTDIDFVDDARNDDFVLVSGRLTYRLTRRLNALTRLEYRDRDSTELQREFGQFEAIIGLNYRLW